MYYLCLEEFMETVMNKLKKKIEKKLKDQAEFTKCKSYIDYM